MTQKAKILVTGASGLLGANFVVEAARLNHSLIAAYHQHPLALPGVTVVQTDLTDRQAVRQLIREHHPEWIVHCAAATDVNWCELHPEETFRHNRDAPGFLAEAALETGAGMAYVSTDAVFDGEHGGYREDDMPGPQNIYAQSKLAGEEVVQEVLARHLIFRGTLFGWNMQPKHSLSEWFLNALETGSPVLGFTDVIFSPLLASDMSALICAGIVLELTGCYHLGSADPSNKFTFGRLIAEEFQLDSSIISPASCDAVPSCVKRPKNTSLNTEKTANALGRSMPSVLEGIQQFRHQRDTGYAARLKEMGYC